jgi:hypothetical protein
MASVERAAQRGVELDPRELAAWRGLLRVHAALVKALDAELVAEHDLPLSSYEVLMTLQAAPGRRCRMAELADRVLLSRSGMTRLVDRLEREGLLERDSCTSDGRPTHLQGIRERFLRHFHDEELGAMAAWWERMLPNHDLSPAD